MFNKKVFADIIRNIKMKYDSQEEFAKRSCISRTYLSGYMNMKIDDIPSRKLLQKLANASFNEITYERLLILCDYIDEHFEPLFYSELYVHNPYVKNDYILEDVIMDIAYMHENIKSIASNSNDIKLINDAYEYANTNITYKEYIQLYNKLVSELQQKNYIICSNKIPNELKDVRMASYNGVDVEGLSDKEIDEIKQFVEFVRNKNKK